MSYKYTRISKLIWNFRETVNNYKVKGLSVMECKKNKKRKLFQQFANTFGKA